MNYLWDFLHSLRYGPTPITRDQLGKLGGNPHFVEPPYDPINDRLQGVAPDWKRYDREKQG